MAAYYNEWEPYPAQWLRNLIKAGLIASGDVDERSIKDVKADDLKEYAQCHFFAGIAGWSYALRLAGWADDRPVWTGSCPCQPFSTAGSKKGGADIRHLWPTWKALIKECKPSTIFGEQVRNAIAYGWLDETFSDLEEQDYSCAASVLPALCGQTGHERERLWFVAHAEDANDYRNAGKIQGANERRTTERQERRVAEFSGSGDMGGSIPTRKSTAGNPCWIECPDRLLRRMPPEPEMDLLAYGIPDYLAQQSAYGNAIVPQVAQAFIEAFMSVRP